MKKNQGFTLIELIAVIVILGVLAAFAIPRYADLQANARKSAIQGLAGTFRGASALSHAASIANGTATTATGTVTMEGNSVAMAYGYPTGAAAGIGVATTISSDFTCTYAGGVATCQMASGGLSTCQVVYTAATSATTPATIATTVTAC